ncbi:MAG: penicillin acylase family protein [Proteobacteria bacterium]|nr:penicillin acylase family protein [Pseudomonadota bacterium]
MRWLPALLLMSLSCTTEEVETVDPYDVQVGPYNADVRWTAYGIPHILAEDYGSLGFGMGYAFAKDNVCVLADQVVKVRSERAKWFGPGPSDAHIDSDFGWLHLGVVAQAEEGFVALEPDLQDAIIGYAAGYNRYVEEVGVDNLPPACAGAEWFPELNHIDLLAYYLHLGQFASGYVFADLIGNAVPPDGRRAAAPPAERLDPILNPGLGSNGWAIGRDKSTGGKGMLLSNTHFPGQGERRWHESHLTIPGEINVYGASLMGVPVINIGFNENVAWTHTVSNTPRFVVHELALEEDNPTTYAYDGGTERMTPHHYIIDVKQDDGSVERVPRTLFTSRYGPVVNMPVVGWTPLNAFSYRDVNDNNTGLSQTWLKMNTATDLESFKAAHRDYQGIPWVHTLYADDQGNAFYTDSAATPNLSEAAEDAYETFLDEGVFASLFAGYGVFVVDGADPVNTWVEDPRSVLPGAIPFDDNPQLLRSDFVSNANENMWLANPLEPLEGYPLIYGDTGTRRTPRTKMNNRFLMESGADGASGADGTFTLDEVEAAALSARASVSEDLRDQVVTRCTGAAAVDLGAGPIDIAAACAVLASWDGRSGVDSRGAHLWREFMMAEVFDTEDLGDRGKLYGDSFDPKDPIYTPSTLAAAPSTGADPILVALAEAVTLLDEAGLELDARLGDVQVQIRGDEEIEVLGGQYAEGLISIGTYSGRGGNSTLLPAVSHNDSIHERTQLGPGGYVVNSGNSWVMAMEFTDEGPEARAVMTYSQSEDPESPHYADQSHLYATGAMRPILFTEADIAADPELVELTLTLE